jgi:hypothetical protein
MIGRQTQLHDGASTADRSAELDPEEACMMLLNEFVNV